MEKYFGCQLDKEWVDLIIKAKDLGLKPEEIRQFLLKKSMLKNI